MSRQLIIIPGLGDHARFYGFFRLVWCSFGFETHIYAFGWDGRADDFEPKMQALLRYIDGFGAKQLYLIGVSAGGTVAVNALVTRPGVIAKIVTISSPYRKWTHTANKLLERSIKKLQSNLDASESDIKKRILSVHGISDNVVEVSRSKPTGVVHKQIQSIGHGLNIFLALTLFSAPVRRFFRPV